MIALLRGGGKPYRRVRVLRSVVGLQNTPPSVGVLLLGQNPKFMQPTVLAHFIAQVRLPRVLGGLAGGIDLADDFQRRVPRRANGTQSPANGEDARAPVNANEQ